MPKKPLNWEEEFEEDFSNIFLPSDKEKVKSFITRTRKDAVREALEEVELEMKEIEKDGLAIGLRFQSGQIIKRLRAKITNIKKVI